MAATVQISQLNGAGESRTDKTSGTVRFRRSDSAVVDLNNPLISPTSQTEYSYFVYNRLYISGGTFTSISNLRAYTDGTNGYGTGIKLWWKTSATYTQPVIPSVAVDPPQHDGGAMVNAFTYTSAAPIDMDDLNTGPFDSTGLPKHVGNYLVQVLEVEIGATQGVKTAEPISFSFDELS